MGKEFFTVGELIEHLKQFDQDLPVAKVHDAWSYWPELDEITKKLYTDDGSYLHIDDDPQDFYSDDLKPVECITI